MKKYLGRLVIALLSCMYIAMAISCVSSSGVSENGSSSQIQPGSSEDPFKGTSWSSKGVTLLEFADNGKVAYGYTTVSYKVKNDGSGYIATFRAGGVGLTFTIDNATATEGVCVSGRVKMSCTKIK